LTRGNATFKINDAVHEVRDKRNGANIHSFCAIPCPLFQEVLVCQNNISSRLRSQPEFRRNLRGAMGTPEKMSLHGASVRVQRASRTYHPSFLARRNDTSLSARRRKTRGSSITKVPGPDLPGPDLPGPNPSQTRTRPVIRLTVLFLCTP